MGVDIAFYIEVRNQENWVRLHFKPPFETKEDINHIGTPTATSAGIITFPISLMRQQAISGVAPRTESAKKSQSTLKTTTHMGPFCLMTWSSIVTSWIRNCSPASPMRGYTR